MRRSYWAACAVVLLLTPVAGAIELSIRSDQGVRDHPEVPLSETLVIFVHLYIGPDDPNVSFIDIFFDATPINDPETAGYDVVGREFQMERNDGSRWLDVEEWNGLPGMEDYRLIAGDGDDPIGTNGPWSGTVDSIIIHGTEIGEYFLYFENQYTSEGNPRPPLLRDRDGFEIPDVVFGDGWRDDEKNSDRPFYFRVIPEPSTMVLMAVAAVGFIRHRRGC